MINTDKVQNLIYKFGTTIGMLPTSFKNSLTYEEQLFAIDDYINKVVVPALNTNVEALQELQNLFLELQDYVNNYFDNLDVQEEINKKLDEMQLNGVFNEFFAPIIQEVNSVKTNYRNKNILIGMDDLTQEVKEAMTGESVAVVGENSVNTINIVNEAVTYPKVKNNLMLSQDLKFSAATYNAKNMLYNLTLINRVIQSSTGNVIINDTTNKNLGTLLPISPNGSLLFNNIYTPNEQLYYAIYKYTRATKPEGIFDFTSDMFEIGSITRATGDLGTNYSYVRTINFIEVTEATRFYIDPAVAKMYVYKYERSSGNFVNYEETNDITINVDNYKYKLVITYGDTTYFKFTSDDIPLFTQIITQNFYNFIEVVANGEHGQFIIPYDPQYVYHFRFNVANPSNLSDRIILPSTTTNYNDYLVIADNVNIEDYNIINKKFSVIGDSFSAYTGIIPEENLPYYNGSNAGVSSVNDMWWQKLVSSYGCQRLVIEAWSGSSVSNIGSSASNVPMSDTSRCQNLSSNDVNPEMIIIMGGTNDFSHANPNLGTYNGTQSFPSTNNDFRSAYALMLQRIRQSYPNADVFCCSLPLFVRVPENKYVPQLNDENQSVTNYNKAIQEISSLMNAHYIDLNECGFTPTNYYPNFCQDSETRPTHPNAAGQQVIANVIANNIIKFYKTKANKN